MEVIDAAQVHALEVFADGCWRHPGLTRDMLAHEAAEDNELIGAGEAISLQDISAYLDNLHTTLFEICVAKNFFFCRSVSDEMMST